MNNADTPANPLHNQSGKPLDLTDGHIDAGYLEQKGRIFSTGLSKREHFAVMAMQGLLAGGKAGAGGITNSSLVYADALLAALDNQQQGESNG